MDKKFIGKINGQTYDTIDDYKKAFLMAMESGDNIQAESFYECGEEPEKRSEKCDKEPAGDKSNQKCECAEKCDKEPAGDKSNQKCECAKNKISRNFAQLMDTFDTEVLNKLKNIKLQNIDDVLDRGFYENMNNIITKIKCVIIDCVDTEQLKDFHKILTAKFNTFSEVEPDVSNKINEYLDKIDKLERHRHQLNSCAKKFNQLLFDIKAKKDNQDIECSNIYTYLFNKWFDNIFKF